MKRSLTPIASYVLLLLRSTRPIARVQISPAPNDSINHRTTIKEFFTSARTFVGPTRFTAVLSFYFPLKCCSGIALGSHFIVKVDSTKCLKLILLLCRCGQSSVQRNKSIPNYEIRPSDFSSRVFPPQL